METKRTYSVTSAVIFALASLIPLGWILIRTAALFNNEIFNATDAIFFLIPICALLLLYFRAFSNDHVFKRIASCIFVLVLFLFATVIAAIFGKYEELHHNEGADVSANYAQATKEFELMPSLNEVGNPQEIDYYDYFSSRFLIFSVNSDTLICKYTEADYEMQKTAIDQAFVFFEGDIPSGSEHTCEASVNIDGYVFRVLSDGEYAPVTYFPKCVVLIATNDAKHEIVYMSFYDDDLDYVQDLTDFINEECGFKHVKSKR